MSPPRPNPAVPVPVPVPALAAAALLAAAVWAGVCAPVPAAAATALSVVRVAQGLARPLFVTSPPGDDRLFIVEQRGADARGRIKIVKNGALLATPFLTTAPLSTGNEQGLLGLAFAPDYATSGRFYVNYTDAGGTSRIVRYRVSTTDPDVADTLSAEVILSVAQPYSNHNCGWMAFGPDGYLWVPFGDGGNAGDPGDRAQNLNELLGKMLRLDVRGPTGYAIPADNPFAGPTAGRDEIWALGLRNPWRCSFDRLTGDLVIADVGQNTWEEVDFAPFAGGLGKGANYGWKCWEGNVAYGTSTTTPCLSCANAPCFVFPAWTYDHTLGRCSVTGGYVYRGCAIPDLQGTYFFADYCGAQVYTGKFVGGALTGVADRAAELAFGTPYTVNQITSFGEDAKGELYLCDQGGEVYKIVPRTAVAEGDLPALRVATALGDTLGSTGLGNALTPGITAFADAGSRIAGVGDLRTASRRDCDTIASGCLTVPLRLGTWDVDLNACVDAAAARLTRRFVFTNRAATAQPLAFRDVIAPYLEGDADRVNQYVPAAGDTSPQFVLADYDAPTRWLSQRGFGSGAAVSFDVGSKAAIQAEVAADQPLAGAKLAGPGQLAIALGFDFGAVAPAARETVTVVTALAAAGPLDVPRDAPPGGGSLLRALGPMPFRDRFAFALDLPARGAVSLGVYDGRGRLVRALFDGELEAGPRGFTWDGRDARGAEAPAGLYFVRARTPGGEASLRALRLR